MNTTITNIAAAIAMKEVERNRIAGFANQCNSDRASREAGIADKASAVAAAADALADARVSSSLGTGQPGDKDAAVAAHVAAEKSLAAERKAQAGEIGVLTATEAKFAAHVAMMEGTLADLRRDLGGAKRAALKASRDTSAAAYTRLAPDLARHFAACLAADEFLMRCGEDTIRTAETAHACLPSWVGHVSTDASFLDMLAVERLRLFAEHGSPSL